MSQMNMRAQSCMHIFPSTRQPLPGWLQRGFSTARKAWESGAMSRPEWGNAVLARLSFWVLKGNTVDHSLQKYNIYQI